MFNKTQNDQERLSAWRQFRQEQYQNKSSIEQIIEAFANIPVLPRYLDYYTPESWPSVFEIVHDGEFCQSGITLILTATLYDLDFIKTDAVTLKVVSNHITGNEGLVLIYDGKAYNFFSDEIVSEQYMNDNSTIYQTHTVLVNNILH